MKILLAAMLLMIISTGCEEVHIGGQPIIRYGERVQIINNLRYEVVITYRASSRSRQARFYPGQEGVITGLGSGEYLVAQVYHGYEVIGTTSYRIRNRDGSSQLWIISSFRGIR